MKYFVMIFALFLLVSCNQKATDSETKAKEAEKKEVKKEKVKKEEAKKEEVKKVAWGNTSCPVMDDPVEEGFSATYEGKVVGFCCKKCIKKFKANPKKYHDALVKYSKK